MILLVGLLSMLLAGVVRSWMMSRYRRWGSVANRVGASGFETARHILDQNHLQHVTLEETAGKLSDHYIPAQKRIRLSDTIGPGRSIAAMAVAAHEVGHALQDADGYGPLKAKAVMMPVAAAGNQLGLVGTLAAGFLGLPALMNASIMLLFSGIVIQLLALPIEFDASRRARLELQRLNLVTAEESEGVASMLNAAALTYVASAASSLAFLAVFALQIFRRR